VLSSNQLGGESLWGSSAGSLKTDYGATVWRRPRIGSSVAKVSEVVQVPPPPPSPKSGVLHPPWLDSAGGESRHLLDVEEQFTLIYTARRAGF